MKPEHIIKRDEAVEAFDIARIAEAIRGAQEAVGQVDVDMAEELADVVSEQLDVLHQENMVRIEDVQDMVIQVLQESGNYRTAQAYMRYRDARERERRLRWANREKRSVGPHLKIIGRDARIRDWDRQQLLGRLRSDHKLSAKMAKDVVQRVELILADCTAEEIPASILQSFVETALCQCGAHLNAMNHAPLRVDEAVITTAYDEAQCGSALQDCAAQRVLEQWSLNQRYPAEVMRLYACGRLWVDGMGDPLRGSTFISNFAGRQDPWEVISRASALAIDANKHWRDVSLILPPMILGQLEREASELLGMLESLSRIANIYLYCDGRTPLLDQWPLQSKRIGLATYEDDFLLQGRLQELGLPMMTGAYLNQEGYRKRVALRLAINAQGLEDNHGRMDHLAMALVSAVRVRLKQLESNPETAGADIRFSIFGLPPSSSSNQYLERQVIQEGLREGIALSRSANLSYEACEHLARLFE